jgi:hypothetical protein
MAAGNIYSEKTIQKYLKPLFNPLIVHIASTDKLKK